ncbi:MAG: polyprenol monophosphomannose synthase [Chloroflexi bacterium]|nr:polyprenol monophosphomannose synthase [Chloroflexota bacterium]MCI0888913.1 polyprenol monophosphomannose synthase [Chloroflexota bacterium]
MLLTVIVPTYNERTNIGPLTAAVFEALGDTPVEVLVVDDASPDGTGDAVTELARDDPRVRLLRRERKQGLAGAVFAGADDARGEYVCVMDADLSHDPAHLPGMLAKAAEGYDIVIGSRFAPGAGFGQQPLARRVASVLANGWARAVLRLPQRDVLTGYVLCRRELLTEMGPRHSAGGFKWLMEMLVSNRDARTFEWPIVFLARRSGSSKANAREALAFLVLSLRLALRRQAR